MTAKATKAERRLQRAYKRLRTCKALAFDAEKELCAAEQELAIERRKNRKAA